MGGVSSLGFCALILTYYSDDSVFFFPLVFVFKWRAWLLRCILCSCVSAPVRKLPCITCERGMYTPWPLPRRHSCVVISAGLCLQLLSLFFDELILRTIYYFLLPATCRRRRPQTGQTGTSYHLLHWKKKYLKCLQKMYWGMYLWVCNNLWIMTLNDLSFKLLSLVSLLLIIG